jgi:hypothetical protein
MGKGDGKSCYLGLTGAKKVVYRWIEREGGERERERIRI